jgi:hypothetical protein
MKSFAVAAAVAAVLALAGCGAHAAAAPPAPSATATATPSPSPTVAALTCKQQGAQWKAANQARIRRFKRALVPFESGTVTTVQAHALSSTAQAMTNNPLPVCADPKGYYTQAMANLATAGAAASGGGALSELGALGPMENALTSLTELSAEMKQTIGTGKL